MLSSDTAQIFFEDVRVPQDYLIGEEGMGFTYQMIQFQAERMWGTAAGNHIGFVKQKCAFKHAQNVQFQIILCICKVSSRPLLDSVLSNDPVSRQ